MGAGAGPGGGVAGDGADDGHVDEERLAAVYLEAGGDYVETSVVLGVDRDVSVAEHPFDVAGGDACSGFLQDLAPRGEHGAMPGMCAAGPNAGKPMVAVGVKWEMAAFAFGLVGADREAKAAAKGRAELGVGEPEGRRVGRSGEPGGGKGAGAGKQASFGRGGRIGRKTKGAIFEHAIEFLLLEGLRRAVLPSVGEVTRVQHF